ncbi:MAG TPA: PHP domain-containing protein [Candidatus Nanopelagicaceae bacterium]|nr:PHP domain-containing protein [Candidatus Nanopelagicaceae bacterium]
MGAAPPPAVPVGYAVADPHAHTLASDGMVSATELVRAAAAVGLGVLAVTDHDNFGAIPEAREAGLRFGVDVVAGEEVTTDKPARVHVVGLFLDGPVRMGMPVGDTIRAIHDQGGLAILAHPFMPTYFASITPAGLRGLISRQAVDGIELRHTAVTTSSRIRELDAFYELHQDRLGAAVGSSDSHFGAHDLARTVTLFPGSTAADLRRAIEARQTIPLEKYRQPAGPALTTRLQQQARSMGWLAWQRWRGKIGREGA